MKIYFLFLLVCSITCTTLKPSPAHQDPMPQKGIKIAVANFRVEGGQTLSGHMARIEKLAEKASTANASYFLLPELTVFDLMPVNVEDNKANLELLKLSELAPRYEEGLINISKKYKLNVIGASMVFKKDKHFLNRALFIDPQGKVHYQDKLRPTPWEARYHFKGGSRVNVFTTPDFSFVILICHDAEFPDISTKLSSTAPQVIFVPSMTDDQFGLNRVKVTASARAIEHMAYVLMTGTSAQPDAPWHAYLGQNHLFTPQNKYFKDSESTTSPFEETLTFYELDLTKLEEARSDLKQVYPARDMKSTSVIRRSY